MPSSTARQQFLGTNTDCRAQNPTQAEAPPAHALSPPVSNARLGMVMLIAAETMLFIGLIGSYLMFRIGSIAWPSAHLYLPIGVTWVNTAILLSSGYTIQRAVHAARINDRSVLLSRLGVTTLLGIVFLAIQGHEWLQLVRDGLTISTGIYGATFYTLIGCHALHVLAAVLWLGILWRQTQQRISLVRVEICRMYWQYVCALWVVLFTLVYLN